MTEGPPPQPGTAHHRRAAFSLLTCDTIEAPRAARAFVRERCAAWGVTTEISDVVILLTSELVTNAARYAPPPLDIVLRWDGGQAQVVVADSDPEPPQPRRPDLDAVGGRGLWLVGMLSSSWGYDATAHGKRVWFVRNGAPPRIPPTLGARNGVAVPTPG